MQPLSSFQIALATRIAASPDDFHQSPARFREAWAILKQARGHRFAPHRLTPAYLIGSRPKGPGPAAPACPPPPAPHIVQAVARRAA